MSFRHLPRISGARIGQLAQVRYVCHGCGASYPAPKPAQCASCGRMDFARLDSKAEARRWAYLQVLERQGIIRNLRRQVSYDLKAPNLETGLIGNVARYIADFVYEELVGDDWQFIIEDVKGGITDVAALKLRWMEAQGLPVRITT